VMEFHSKKNQAFRQVWIKSLCLALLMRYAELSRLYLFRTWERKHIVQCVGMLQAMRSHRQGVITVPCGTCVERASIMLATLEIYSIA
jgi:hypothetical protein